MITSLQNPKIKRVRLLNSQSKSRKKQGAFVLEGVRLLEESLNAGIDPELVLHTPDLDQRGTELVAQFQDRGVPAELTAPEIFEAASDTTSPQGILGILPLISIPFPHEANFILITDEIRDPGNLGTLMRSAAAAGVDALIVTPGTVDPYSPKVTRAAMGAHFHLPVKSASWGEISNLTKGMQCLLADMNAGLPIWDANLADPTAIILGSEAHGAGIEARQLAEQSVHIPMEKGTESLNAASAGAVLLFEVRRQRSGRNK